MGTPFLAEIKIISFNFPPKGWAFCNGQTLPIAQNQALFSLLGTTYGGNGQTTFMLPNLQGRTPIHMGDGFTLGEKAGATSHTLTSSELPRHSHQVSVTTLQADNTDPTGKLLAVAGANLYHEAAGSIAALDPGTISSVGGSQPHENTQPYLVLNFVIALQGIFPSQS